MAAKPTILLIPGACTESTCFDRLRPYLHRAGYETVAVSHPSANPTDPFAHDAETFALNVQNVYLQPLLDAGKDVLVYAYSSGGSQTGTNGPSWIKSEREARGEKGGVVGVVYMSCAPVPAGVDQLTFMGGSWPPFVKGDTVCTYLQPFRAICIHTNTTTYSQALASSSSTPSSLTSSMTPIRPSKKPWRRQPYRTLKK